MKTLVLMLFIVLCNANRCSANEFNFLASSGVVEWKIDLQHSGITVAECKFYNRSKLPGWSAVLQLNKTRTAFPVLEAQHLEELVVVAIKIFFSNSNAKSCTLSVSLEEKSRVYRELSVFFASRIDVNKSGFLKVDTLNVPYKEWAEKSFPRMRGLLEEVNLTVQHSCDRIQAFADFSDDGKAEVGFLEPVITFKFDRKGVDERPRLQELGVDEVRIKRINSD
jgi:hypothetical protein